MSGRDQNGQLGAEFKRQSPTLFAVILFFLLFSGPPSFRLRDPTDSLEGVIDPTVVFQVSVWVVAGMWTVYQLRKEFRARSSIKLDLPDKLGLWMILFLGLSSFLSDAPMLTAFKVGQILVSLLFTWLFVHRYGIAKCIDYVFLGSTILCTAIAVSAFAAPDLVLFSDEGHMRLRGDPIAVMGTVGTYSTILLVIKRRQVPRVIFWPLLAMLCTLLAFSLTRSAWFLVFASLLLYFARQSKGTFVRNLGFLFLAVFPFVFFFYILPALQEYRATESVATLTGRTDLWVYLVGVALLRSPWVGLGYYSASRILGPDFNPGMGTAHSIFVEVFLGGGLVSLIPCMALCFLLARKAFKFLSKDRTDLEFLCGLLFLVTLTISLLGGDFSSGEIGITFWSLAAAIPAMALRRPVPNSPVSAPIHSKPSPITGKRVMPPDGRRATT
jgi:O-antigen ligase